MPPSFSSLGESRLIPARSRICLNVKEICCGLGEKQRRRWGGTEGTVRRKTGPRGARCGTDVQLLWKREAGTRELERAREREREGESRGANLSAEPPVLLGNNRACWPGGKLRLAFTPSGVTPAVLLGLNVAFTLLRVRPQEVV